MAVPKRKTSKARKRKRRTHWKFAIPTLVSCPKCLQPKVPHRVCPHCGVYKGRQVLEAEEF